MNELLVGANNRGADLPSVVGTYVRSCLEVNGVQKATYILSIESVLSTTERDRWGIGILGLGFGIGEHVILHALKLECSADGFNLLVSFRLLHFRNLYCTS